MEEVPSIASMVLETSSVGHNESIGMTPSHTPLWLESQTHHLHRAFSFPSSSMSRCSSRFEGEPSRGTIVDVFATSGPHRAATDVSAQSAASTAAYVDHAVCGSAGGISDAEGRAVNQASSSQRSSPPIHSPDTSGEREDALGWWQPVESQESDWCPDAAGTTISRADHSTANLTLTDQPQRSGYRIAESGRQGCSSRGIIPSLTGLSSTAPSCNSTNSTSMPQLNAPRSASAAACVECQLRHLQGGGIIPLSACEHMTQASQGNAGHGLKSEIAREAAASTIQEWFKYSASRHSREIAES
mmetsp:Transcript_52287/g.60028  ORF Transcript_52287/g.60028 Transcript_52287/m.60028 type:complete len:301 (-) Transcript_52287:217-1119(-)